MKSELERLAQDFHNPPDIYGELPCYWWEAGDLQKEKLHRQLQDMRQKGASGTVLFNLYFPGERLSSRPAFFSEEWWDIIRFVIEEEKNLGMEFWFSDWAGRRYWQNLILKEAEKDPRLQGHRLQLHAAESTVGRQNLEITVPPEEEILDAAAYRKTGSGLEYGSRVDLNATLQGRSLRWTAPQAGWLLTVVSSAPHDLDYLDGAAAGRWLELYWEKFKEKLPAHLGKTIKGYIQDELYVLNGNILFSQSIFEAFPAEELKPGLIALFYDVGDITDRVRCRYYDAMIGLLEKNLYGKVAKWHRDHGVVFGTEATWGRLDAIAQTYHYGDFFRMMRHFHLTGNEDPRYSEPGERRLIDDKLSSSVANLYGQSAVMVDCYWQSGWGVTQEQNIAWTNENYAYGMNCYNRHCVLYTLMGGWREWVPPAVYFYQPYWRHWRVFSDYMKRLSFMLRRGRHVADAAVLYPMSTIHAGWSSGNHFSNTADFSARRAFSIATLIYRYNIDFDFLDEDSLAGAVVQNGRLSVAGMSFKALVLPPMTTVRTSTLGKIREFYDGGGVIIGYNILPNACAETGRNDRSVRDGMRHVFGIESSENHEVNCRWFEERVGYSIHRQANPQGGRSFFVPGDETLIPKILVTELLPDVKVTEALDALHDSQSEPVTRLMEPGDKKLSGIFHIHRRDGALDIYFFYNSNEEEKFLELQLEARGRPEIWDCFSGTTRPHFSYRVSDRTTRVRLKMEKYEGIVLVLQPYEDQPHLVADNLVLVESLVAGPDNVWVKGYVRTGGRKKVLVGRNGRTYVGESRVENPPAPIHLLDDWDFTLIPTMDNQDGDFRYPASRELIGAEARRYRYRMEMDRDGESLGWASPQFDDSGWSTYRSTFGPFFWALDPVPADQDPPQLLEDIERNLLAPEKQYQAGKDQARWTHYNFSLEFGHEDPEVHNRERPLGPLGSEEQNTFLRGLEGVSENYLVFPQLDSRTDAARYLLAYIVCPHDKDVALDFGGTQRFPRKAWLNGKKVMETSVDQVPVPCPIHLNEGINVLVVRLVQIQGLKFWTYLDIRNPNEKVTEQPLVPRLKWFRERRSCTYDVSPGKGDLIGWYRFEAPAGLKEMRLDLEARQVACWINGKRFEVRGDRVTVDAPQPKITTVALKVLHAPGYYAGAAVRSPVRFTCEKTKMPLGNWEDAALESYSGGALYENVFYLNDGHLKGKVFADLGAVKITCELKVNGKPAGTRLASPYRFDITGLVRKGVNQLSVTVYNTLANHYHHGFPTAFVYRNQTVSGLLGPVTINFMPSVTLNAVAQEW